NASRPLVLAGRAMATAPPATNNAPKPAPTAKKPLVPPEERFWVRYSPHHEFPWSTVSSVALHLIGAGLVALVVLDLLGWGRDSKPLPLQPVMLGDDKPEGAGAGTGGQPPESRTERAQDEPRAATPSVPDLPKEDDKIAKPATDPAAVPREPNPGLSRLIAEANASQSALSKLDKAVQEKLIRGLD